MSSDDSLPAVVSPAVPAIAATATTPDEQLVNLWLNGRSENTQRAYRRDAGLFTAYVNKPLKVVKLDDLQSFGDYLARLALKPSTRHRVLSSIKSLFAFGARLGFLSFDTAFALRLPTFRDGLADRILDEDEVRRLLAAETDPRNQVILRLLYFSGIRCGELVGLKWRDTKAHRGAGQITVFGKGSKTRTIRIESGMWQVLDALRGSATADAPVFISRRGGHLDESMVFRIVQAAAKLAGIEKNVSPHWLRHCHASHSIDNGATLNLVQQTLGHSNVATTSRYLHARPGESSSRFLPNL